MRRTLETLDGLLRGDVTRAEGLREGRLEVEERTLLVACVALGAAYGLFMGVYAAMRGGPGSALQVLTTVVKVPLLFLLTLLVTFPSLYVVSALAQCRLTFVSTLRLLLATMTVNLALLASFGPVTGFFTLSTTSYAFMIVLNVTFFAVSGFVGLGFLNRALGLVFDTPPLPPASAMAGGARPEAAATGPTDAPVAAVSIPPMRLEHGRSSQASAERTFRIWVLIYAVVGAQMGWILRPFIGAPNAPFQLLRARESNFFVVLVEQLRVLLGG